MSFLIIIDNGQSYPDHHHWPVCVCATLGDANAAKARWDDWKSRALAASKETTDEDEEYDWQKRMERAEKFLAACPHPEPFSERDLRPYDFEYYSCQIIEIPAWAA